MHITINVWGDIRGGAYRCKLRSFIVPSRRFCVLAACSIATHPSIKIFIILFWNSLLRCVFFRLSLELIKDRLWGMYYIYIYTHTYIYIYTHYHCKYTIYSYIYSYIYFSLSIYTYTPHTYTHTLLLTSTESQNSARVLLVFMKK